MNTPRARQEELNDDGPVGEVASRVGIDGARNQFRHHQVQRVADDGERHQHGDEKLVGLQQHHQPCGGRWSAFAFCDDRAHT